MLTQAEQTRLIHLHLNSAGECRRAAMSGGIVGFYGPAGHKASARIYLADVRQRRLMLEA